MSNQVYPDLPGLAFGVQRVPSWSTDIRTTPSRREYRSTDQIYALRRRTLVYEFLRTYLTYTELQSLEGFFNLHRGALESFLFTDPDDQSVTLQAVGVGDGANKDFQLVRTWGGVVEPIAARNGTASIYKDGVLQSSGFSFVAGDVYPSNTTVVHFTTAPANGVVVAWTGSYYWRCRFSKDELAFEKFLYKLWAAKSVDLFDCRT